MKISARALATVRQLSENIQRRILQQHDRLRVHDSAVADHLERLIERQFQHLNILALMRETAARADSHR